VAPSMQDKAAWISDISQVYNCWNSYNIYFFSFFVIILICFLFFFFMSPAVYRQRPFQRLCAQFHLGRLVRDSSALGAQRPASLQRRHRHSIQPHPQLVQSQSPRAVGSVVNWKRIAVKQKQKQNLNNNRLRFYLDGASRFSTPSPPTRSSRYLSSLAISLIVDVYLPKAHQQSFCCDVYALWRSLVSLYMKQ
jgi:hypothetical protein